ncbi:MAG: hypothetical protein H8E47_09560 [Anaerolineales bacterium]|nr:hypothetical protein [Anaerolineales bacterium]
METIESISAKEWERLVDEFIDREAEGFDELPASTFFEAWAAIEEMEPVSVPVQIRIQEGRVSLIAPPTVGLQTKENQLRLEDGRVLVFTLEPAQA